MAVLPKIAKLSLENLTGATQEDKDKVFVEAVNGLRGSAVSSLDKGLSFTDNFDAQFADLSVSVPDDWQSVTFGTDWGQWSNASYANVGYRKDVNGMVHLRGLADSIDAGAATAIFTVPVAYRPPAQIYLATHSNGAFAAVTITTAGVVTYATGSRANEFSLYGVHWQASDQSPIAPSCFPKNVKVTLKGKVGDVCATNITETGSGLVLPPRSVDWKISDSSNSKQITIRNIPGLMPNKSYKIRLRILPE